ncbi:hypothetical protein BHE74_00035048 [Ensete ventricosum]|nr:hypothetical protein BHE74_00035048 [Ensete ventricosum]
MEERTGRGQGLGLRPARKALNPSSAIWKPMRSCPSKDPKQTSVEAFRERSNPRFDDDDNLRSPNSPFLVGTCPDMCPELLPLFYFPLSDRYCQMGNYKRFFSSLEAEASDLQLCLVEPFLDEVKTQHVTPRARSIENDGQKDLMLFILIIQEYELEDLCHVCGLETSIDEAGIKTLPVKQTKFSLPRSGFRSYCLSAIDDVKRYVSLLI